MENGVRFECQGSGRCCTSRGSHGYVYLSLKDRRRFARFFEIPTAEFTKRFCRKTDGYFHLKDSEDDCRFLKENRCTVYEARPTQCRTWPFWPEYLNARAWNKQVKALCPGVGKGRLYSWQQIQTLAAEDRKNLIG